MTNGQPNTLLKHVRKLVAKQAFRNLADRELLDCFIDRHDEAAFAALVERHGSMTLGVCRRVLRNDHDAEDACQATFLVLARKAGSIRKKDSIGSWLHGVAFRVASDQKKRGKRGVPTSEVVTEVPGGDANGEVTLREAQTALDEELNRLGECYRAPLVLCYLEGKTRDEAAQQLGWKLGTLRSRLERARELLRSRLLRRGVGPSVALLSMLFGEAASASMPATLALSTAKAASLLALGQTIPETVVSPQVISLTEGVVKAMFLSKLKISAVVTLLVIAFGLAGLSTVPQPALAQEEPDKAAERRQESKNEETKKQAVAQALEPRQFLEAISWSLTKVDAEKATVSAVILSTPHIDDLFDEEIAEAQQNGATVRMVHARSALAGFPLVTDAKVFIDGREASVKDLKSGMRASMRLADDKMAISRIDALSPSRPVLKCTDVEKNTITIVISTGKELTVPLTFRTKIYVGGSRFVQEFAGDEEGQFTDLKVGMLIDMQLAVENDRIVATVVKAYRPAKN